MILTPASNEANHQMLIDALINELIDELTEQVYEDMPRLIAELTAAQESGTTLEEIQQIVRVGVEGAIRNMKFG